MLFGEQDALRIRDENLIFKRGGTSCMTIVHYLSAAAHPSFVPHWYNPHSPPRNDADVNKGHARGKV